MTATPTDNKEVNEGGKRLAKEFISYSIRNNDPGEIEIQFKIDRIVLDGFDEVVDSKLLAEVIKQDLLSTLSEYAYSTRSETTKKKEANFGFNRNSTPSYISISHINGGSFPLKKDDKKPNAIRLANDVSKAIVKGLITFNGK